MEVQESKMAIIRKFYDTNDIELKWKKIKSYIGKGKDKLNKKDRPYTRVKISKMLEKADQRGRITILLMSSSGIQVGALLHLKNKRSAKNRKVQSLQNNSL